MSESKHEKFTVAPGVIKSGYEKPKERIVNPTMQVAVRELPTAEKSVMYKEYYATTLSTSSCMPMNGEFSIQFITEVSAVTKVSAESPYKKLKKDNKPAVETIKVEEEKLILPEIKIEAPQQPTDTEVALELMEENIEDVPKLKEPEINMSDIEIDLPVTAAVEEISKANVFGTINSMQNTTVSKPAEKPKTDRERYMSIKPFMIVDRVQVRQIGEATDEYAYMIGKEICTHAKFEVFKEEVAGKILAMECNRLELNDVIYKKQSDGIYVDNNGDIVTLDDLLNILHG